MRIPVTNHGDTMLHLGGKVIRPGETRDIDEAFVPDELRPQSAQAEADAPEDPLLALLDGTVKEVESALPGLSEEQLDALEQAEESGKTRKGVMAAIAEDRLRRADEASKLAADAAAAANAGAPAEGAGEGAGTDGANDDGAGTVGEGGSGSTDSSTA